MLHLKLWPEVECAETSSHVANIATRCRPQLISCQTLIRWGGWIDLSAVFTPRYSLRWGQMVVPARLSALTDELISVIAKAPDKVSNRRNSAISQLIIFNSYPGLQTL